MSSDQIIKQYALVDASNAPDFLAMLTTYDPPASCLYNEPLQEGMAERAPYLVELTSESVKAWIASLATPWGLYLISDVDFMAMRSHLRRYTFAMIPASEKPVFFRFYDPRVFWNLTTKILDDWQLHAFLGPIKIVATYLNGEYRQEHFDERRAQFPHLIRMKTQYLTLNEAQFEAFNKIYEEKYIDELAEHMMQYVDASVIEKARHQSDRIHREMLEYERDIEGKRINHPADQALLNVHATSSESFDPLEEATKRKEPAYFYQQYDEWFYVDGDGYAHPIQDERIEALAKMHQIKVMEDDFHQSTHYQYQYYEGLAYLPKMIVKEETFEMLSMDELKATVYRFAEDLFYFLQKQEITYDSSIKGIGLLMVNKNIFRFQDIPSVWVENLRLDYRPGFIRAESLLIDELGYVP